MIPVLGLVIGIALGTFRIVTGTPLHYYIIAGYIIVVIQTVFAPRMIIALAYDSGGVTTSTVTVPPSMVRWHLILPSASSAFTTIEICGMSKNSATAAAT